MRNFKKLKHPYGYVANSIINDKNLTYTAKGVYLYILSKPDNWDFSQQRIAEDSTTSEYSVRKAIKELENNNLLEREKLSNGRIIYSVKDPVQECIIQKTNTTSGSKSQKTNTQPANTQPAKTGGISKKELKVRKSISNKDLSKSEDLQEKGLSREISQIIKDLEEIDIKNKNYYKNKTQRKACLFLIDHYGYINVRGIIRFYKYALAQKEHPNFEVRKEYKFLPELYSPYDFQEKWKKLGSFVKRAKENREQFVDNLVI